MAEPFTVRPIAAADAPLLADFYNHLTPETIRTFRPLGDKTSLQACQRIVEQNTIHPRKRFDLLAYADADLAGWAYLDNLDVNHPDLGIVVHEAHRGHGAGSILLTELLRWAKANDMKRVYLMVVKDNQRAIRLYERYGFVTYDEEFDQADQLPYFHMAAELGPAW